MTFCLPAWRATVPHHLALSLLILLWLTAWSAFNQEARGDIGGGFRLTTPAKDRRPIGINAPWCADPSRGVTRCNSSHPTTLCHGP